MLSSVIQRTCKNASKEVGSMETLYLFYKIRIREKFCRKKLFFLSYALTCEWLILTSIRGESTRNRSNPCGVFFSGGSLWISLWYSSYRLYVSLKDFWNSADLGLDFTTRTWNKFKFSLFGHIDRSEKFARLDTLQWPSLSNCSIDLCRPK